MTTSLRRSQWPIALLAFLAFAAPASAQVAPFDVFVDPFAQEVIAGQTAVYRVHISVAPSSDFDETVQLICNDLPHPSVTCEFTPPSVTPGVTPGDTSVLRVMTTQDTPPVTDAFTVIGASATRETFGAGILTVTPSFMVSAAPASQSVTKGGSALYSVTVAPVNSPFDGPVQLSCLQPLPAGVSCEFEPNEVTPGSQGRASTLTISTTDPDTPDGSYDIVARGLFEAEQYSQDATVELAVGAGSDFTVSLDPSSNTVIGGQDAIYTVSVAATGGFSDPVDLSCGDLPTDVTCEFTPTSVTPGNTAELKVLTAQTTPVGTTTLAVTGTSGASTSTGTGSLTVTPSFSVSASPTSQSAEKGGSTQFSVAVNSVFGSFDEPVRLSCLQPLPAGVACSFQPNEVTPGGGGASSVLTITTTDPDTPDGNYPIEVRGLFEAEQYSQDATVELVVGAASEFTVSVNPSNNAVIGGQDIFYTVSVEATGGSSDLVDLSCSDLPTDVTCEFTPTSVTPGNTSVLQILTAQTTPVGTTTLAVNGTSGSSTHTGTAGLTVTPSFSVSAAPASQSAETGGSAQYSVTVTPVNGSFDEPVRLSCLRLPPGAQCVFEPNEVTPGSQGRASALTVTTSPVTPEGGYTFTVRGSFEAEQYLQDVNVELVVGTADFSIAVAPESRTVPVTGSTTYTVSVGGESTDPVSLTCDDLPAGVTCQIDPVSVAPGGTADVTVTAANAQAQETSFLVTGTSGAGTDTESVPLVLQDFRIAVTPSIDTTTAGSPARYVVEVSPGSNGSQGAFDFDISFSCNGLPAGLACTFAPATVNPGGSDTDVTLTVSTSGSASIPGSTPRGGMPSSRQLVALLAAVALLGLALLARARRPRTALRRNPVRRALAPATLLVALAASVALVSGCGDDATPTDPGSGTAIVTEFSVTGDGAGLLRTVQSLVATSE